MAKPAKEEENEGLVLSALKTYHSRWYIIGSRAEMGQWSGVQSPEQIHMRRGTACTERGSIATLCGAVKT